MVTKSEVKARQPERARTLLAWAKESNFFFMKCSLKFTRSTGKVTLSSGTTFYKWGLSESSIKCELCSISEDPDNFGAFIFFSQFRGTPHIRTKTGPSFLVVHRILNSPFFEPLRSHMHIQEIQKRIGSGLETNNSLTEVAIEILINWNKKRTGKVKP